MSKPCMCVSPISITISTLSTRTHIVLRTAIASLQVNNANATNVLVALGCLIVE